MTKKLKSPSSLHEKSFINWSDLEKKNTREFPLNLIWFYFTGKSFVFFSTFSSILKKSNLEGVFEFFYSDPQLDQNLKPTRNLCGQLLYIYLCIYMFKLYTILFSRDSKTKKVRHPHPHQHQNWWEWYINIATLWRENARIWGIEIQRTPSWTPQTKSSAPLCRAFCFVLFVNSILDVDKNSYTTADKCLLKFSIYLLNVTYGLRTDYSIFTIKSHFLVFFFFSFPFQFPFISFF